jgi:hypothetical protein
MRELIAEGRSARKRWQQTRTPADKTRLNNLSLQLEGEIQEVKNEYINSYLRELTNKKQKDSLWKGTKRMKIAVVHTPTIRKEVGPVGLLPPLSELKRSRSVVVRALCYKPEGRGFNSRWGHWIFFNWPNPSGRNKPWGLLSL